MKRVFGLFEVVFDIAYLFVATILSFYLLLSSQNNYTRMLGGIMAFILVFGDSFHLIPRIIVIRTSCYDKLRVALGRGKQITSITMTFFYVLLWKIALTIYLPNNSNFLSYIISLLAAVRIFLCLMPQNKWTDLYPSLKWAKLRNIPFLLQGMLVASIFFVYRDAVHGFELMWLAIILSFAFYIPVVLWAHKNPKIGMLMLPKTCVYVWMLVMCLCL